MEREILTVTEVPNTFRWRIAVYMLYQSPLI